MKFFPVAKYTLQTKLTPQQVSQKIHENIDAGQMLSVPLFRKHSSKKYEGYVNFREFEINNKRSDFGQTFWVTNVGEIEETGQGTLINVSAYMYAQLYVFFLGLPLILSGTGIYRAITFSLSELKSSLGMIGLALCIYFIGLRLFILYANSAKQFLLKILDARMSD